ncbi:MAG: DNA mismatch repair protein MutS [Ignavibacteria bacterium]|nr:DNA mismatch repair protein MutS [Ignavibacteria bacterium]
MRQYNQIKGRHPDTVLLFRLGDFYETFGDDAVATAKACGITLTKRNNGTAGEIPLAGFPHHQLDTYLPRIVRAGHRVAVCEQLEDPKQAKGIVKRDVVEVVTPGVVLYDKLLDHKSHTYVAAITGPTKNDPNCGLAVADISTGTFTAGDIPMDKLAAMIESLQPAEIIVDKDQRGWWEPLLERLPFTPARTRLESWIFEQEFATNILLRHFQTASLKGFGADSLTRGAIAAGVVLHYVSETQKGALSQITGLSILSSDTTMVLDAATRRNLEIHSSMSGDGTAGALISIVDRSVTPMGGRLLRWWLQSPLIDIKRIQKRHEAVRGFVRDQHTLTEVRAISAGIGDLERLMTKVVTNRATSRDLVGLRSGLQQLPKVKETCTASLFDAVRDLGEKLNAHQSTVDLLQRSLRDEPSLQIGSGQIFRDGYDAALDDATNALLHGKEWIAAYQERQRTESGISTLKVAYTSVFGYYIEISNTHKARVPEHYDRKQTLANAERYTTVELKEFEQKLLSAESTVTSLESRLLDELRQHISSDCAAIQKTATLIATIDALAGFADVASAYGYVEPVMTEETALEIVDARHPVIERLLPHGTPYTSNTVLMDTEKEQLHILTGPNMSGKSSYLRQVGLIVFLAHVGSFVPATSATIPLTDRIFTRVGAQDNIMAGESTFLVEMQESANILNNATKRSIILLDEVGRGTATFDGISIAWAIAEYLHEVIGAKTIFATHYHELTSLADQFHRVHNLQVEVREVGDEIVFTHRVVRGHSDHSFGIHVARMAGLPPAVLATARAVLVQLESGQHGPTELGRTATAERHRLEEAGQISLFEVRDDGLRDRVRLLDINNMTPLQAMQALVELKDSIDE